MKFGYLKVGDTVTRMVGDGPFMQMKVTAVTEDLITCAAIHKDGRLFYGDWTFDRATGVEEDADLGWGVKYGVTGTYLKREDG